jgi:hypothetical protein
MKLPFTTEDFFLTFESYNQEIFPIQILFYLLSIFILYLLVKRNLDVSNVISLILGFFWIWMGFVYHIMFFSRINSAAYIFGSFFVLQGILFIYSGVYKNILVFRNRKDIYSAAAYMLFIYALLVYPVIGHFAGHIYPFAPEMSAPCPTTIFTFGVLLFSSGKFPKWLMIIPLLWSLIGFSAAVNLNVVQDYGLVISGIMVFLLITYRDSAKKMSIAAKGV